MLRTGTSLALAVLTAGLLHWSAPQETRDDLVPVIFSGEALKVSPYEVTIAEWNRCVAAKACEDIAAHVARPTVTPVTNVNWFDVEAYIAWYNSVHVQHVRLPTAEEWRGFSRKPEPKALKPLWEDPRMAWAASYGQEESPRGPVRPQGTWAATPDGVYDIGGNVWEWTSTCAANDARITDAEHCPAMTVMGAHTASVSVFVRDPSSGGCASGLPPTHIGFRLVAENG